jgi:hypothetical protein
LFPVRVRGGGARAEHHWLVDLREGALEEAAEGVAVVLPEGTQSEVCLEAQVLLWWPEGNQMSRESG